MTKSEWHRIRLNPFKVTWIELPRYQRLLISESCRTAVQIIPLYRTTSVRKDRREKFFKINWFPTTTIQLKLLLRNDLKFLVDLDEYTCLERDHLPQAALHVKFLLYWIQIDIFVAS